MQFKIDAKEQYTVITPQKGMLDARLAADLAVECKKQAEMGGKNFIIDLSDCQDVRTDFLLPFIALSADWYEQEKSFVLLHPPAEMIQLIRKEDATDQLNYAPSFAEAMDILSMEILERDLFNEE